MKRYVAQAEAIFSSDKEGVGDGMGGTDSPDSSTSTTLPGGDQEAESLMDVYGPGSDIYGGGDCPDEVKDSQNNCPGDPGYDDGSMNWWDSEAEEVAPPGMEDLVMKLKKQYGDKSSSPFAIAWAQYNKGHKKGKKEAVRAEVLSEAHMSPQLFQEYVKRYAEVGTSIGAHKGWVTKKGGGSGGDAEMIKMNAKRSGLSPERVAALLKQTDEEMKKQGYKIKGNSYTKKTSEEVIGDTKFPMPVDPWTTGENDQGIPAKDIMEPWGTNKGKYHGDGFSRVVQAEAIEAVGIGDAPQLMRKGSQPKALVTQGGGAQEIPLASFKDDLQRKVSLKKMMSPDEPKKKDSKKASEGGPGSGPRSGDPHPHSGSGGSAEIPTRTIHGNKQDTWYWKNGKKIPREILYKKGSITKLGDRDTTNSGSMDAMYNAYPPGVRRGDNTYADSNLYRGRTSEAKTTFEEAYDRVDPDDEEQSIRCGGGSDLSVETLEKVNQAKTAADAFNEVYR